MAIRDRRGVAGWLSYQWAAQPVQSVLFSFIFAPYFVSQVAADPVAGQSNWGLAAASATFATAVFSPSLGAVADNTGSLKPWLALCTVAVAAAAASLWFSVPGPDAPVARTLAAAIVIVVAADFARILSNALMMQLVTPDRMGWLSGLGFSAGYLGGLAALVLALVTMVATPDTGTTVIGSDPIFGLDPGLSEGERATGPLVAIWLLLFSTPLFVLAQDRPPTGVSARVAMGNMLGQLRRTVREAVRHRQVIRFLFANLFIRDGLLALFAFGGIYSISVFGWSVQTMGLSGIAVIVVAAVGAYAGAALDGRVGSWPLCVAALATLTLAFIGLLSVSPERILFVIPVNPPLPDSGPLQSTPEMVYVAFLLAIGLCVGPVQAASRSIMGQIAPVSRSAQYFGLLALSGKITVFVGPLIIGLVTAAAASQRVGMVVIIAFLSIGLALLLTVGPPRRISEGAADADPSGAAE